MANITKTEINYAKRGWLTLLGIPVWVFVTFATHPVINTFENYEARRICELIIEFGGFTTIFLISTIFFSKMIKKNKIYIIFSVVGWIVVILLIFGTYYIIVADN